MKLALLALVWGLFIVGIVADAALAIYAIVHGEALLAMLAGFGLCPLGLAAYKIDQIEYARYSADE